MAQSSRLLRGSNSGSSLRVIGLITTAIAAMICTGTTEQQIIAAVAQAYPELTLGRTVGGPARRDGAGRAASLKEVLMGDKPNSAETILGWLREEAGTHAFQTEAPNYAEVGVVKQRDDFTSIDILVNEGSVGIRARKGDRREYQCLTWGELECAEVNPLIPLIDALASLISKGR